MKSQTTESGKGQEKVNSDSDLKQEQNGNEKSVPSPSTSMDETAPPPSAPPTVPVTVVCAECKRLKLKCDRRSPCGSCTKRDTVSRCIYSAAAAEKVDLHSVNNRLMEVETILAFITAGKTPPQFQSSYPHSQVPLSTTHATPERKKSSTVSSALSPISIRVQDLLQIWLSHCHLDRPLTLPEGAQEPPSIKQEQLATERLQFAEPYPPNTIIIDEGPSDIATTPSPTTTRSNLPHIYMYYSPSTDHAPYQPHDVHGEPSSQSSTFPRPTTGQPAATYLVISYLPSPFIRSGLLDNARSRAPHLPLLIHWPRVVGLADPEDHSRPIIRSAFDAHQASCAPCSAHVPSKPSAVSLPLFACMCYLLALGAMEPASGSPVDHSFLYAFALQATNIWEEYITSAVSKEDESSDDDAYTSTMRSKQAGKEEEGLDYVVALLLQVKYLLRARSVITSGDLSKSLFPAIGKLVNTAREMGLASDPEEESGAQRDPNGNERRRMIWWDIMHHDIFTSDALGHAPLISMSSYTTRMPAIARSTSSLATSVTPLVGGSRQSGHVGAANEHSEGGAFQERPSTSKSSSNSNSRMSLRVLPAAKDEAMVPLVQDDADVGFFGVRCRLTKLAQTLKHRLTSPGCECCTCGNGYTLDQAAKLEGEIRTWAADLPSPLLLEPSSPSQSSIARSPKHAAIAAELAVFANRMIIAAYLPLMRPLAEGTSSSPRAYATNPWSPASRATVDAAQGVVRAARVLHQLTQTGSEALPFMDGLYPLKKAVVDALIICAHSGLASSKTGRATVMLEEVDVALVLLGKMGTLEGDMAEMISSLKRRIEAVGDGSRKGPENLLKRKHSVFEAVQPVDRSVQGMSMTVDLQDEARGNCHDNLSMLPNLDQTPVPVAPSISRSVQDHHEKPSPKKQQKVPWSVRNRGKDNAVWTIETADPASTAEPDPGDVMSSPHDIRNNYQQSMQRRPPPANHSFEQEDNDHRLRSLHRSQGSQLQASPQHSRYVDERDAILPASQRRRFSINGPGQQHYPPPIQKFCQQHEQVQRSFAMSSSMSYISNQPSSCPSTFEMSGGSDSSGSVNGGSTSPYPEPPLSLGGSPFVSTADSPQTPGGYALGSDRPSPPALTQQSTGTSSGSTTYYQMAPGYTASFEGQAVQPQPASMERSMPMSSRISYVHTNEATIPSSSLPPAPISEETPQHLMYAIRGSAEVGRQQQMHPYQLPDERAASGGMPVDPSTPQTWTATRYVQLQQQSLVGQQNAHAQYWSTGQPYYQ
ncbi:hypothetical protein H0H92_009114 [Tricholoma furcatifolium]|nr:hypothetical protein H0H92_009114 [Tricholoma furcatifolium]